MSRHGGYGWVKGEPDPRDHAYEPSPALTTDLPPSVDLRSGMPPVYDQGQLGSCTANGIAAALQFDAIRQQLDDQNPPSRLFIYYNERDLEHTVDSDSGAMIRDGIKTVNVFGACDESMWPYDITQYTARPSTLACAAALLHRAVSYAKITPTDTTAIKACLASGFPVVFGIPVHESFESQQVADDGIVPMPAAGDRIVGGHCMLICGYDDTTQRWLVRNSWGAGWGMDGYCTLPYAYTSKYGDDFWTIRTVTADNPTPAPGPAAGFLVTDADVVAAAMARAARRGVTVEAWATDRLAKYLHV